MKAPTTLTTPHEFTLRFGCPLSSPVATPAVKLPRYSPRAQATIKGRELQEPCPEKYTTRTPYRADEVLATPNAVKTAQPKSVLTKSPNKRKMEIITAKPVAAAGMPPAGIESTNDYSVFKLLATNRPVDKRHVNKLASAIRKKNLLHLNPLVVNAAMEVIDGQHRLEAAKLLGVPVFFARDAAISYEDIAGMNSNKKNWGMADYLHYFYEQGIESYKAFMTLCRTHPNVQPSILMSLCSGDGGRQRTAYKEGRLDISNIGKASAALTQLDDVAAYFDHSYSSRFLEAFVALLANDEYDHGRLRSRMELYPGQLRPAANKRDYIQQLQALYNKGVREDKIVHFIKR